MHIGLGSEKPTFHQQLSRYGGGMGKDNEYKAIPLKNSSVENINLGKSRHAHG